MSTFENVSRNFRRIRLMRGLTQLDVTNRCGIGRAHIGHIESMDVGDITLATLDKLAMGLGTTVADLVDPFVRNT